MTTQPMIKPRLGQLRAGNVLSRLSGPTATDGDTLMLGVNAEATPPLALSPANPASLVVNIGAITVSNPNTGMVQSPSPIGGSLPIFTGGTVTFPSSSGGNAVPSAGSNVAITCPTGDYLRVILAVDGNGNIVVIPGTPSSTIFLTPFPTITRTDIYQAGWVLLQNVGGTIQNISTVYQFKSSGGSGGGGGGLIPAYESSSFTAATGNNYLTNTSTAPVIATLPSGATASSIRFTDDAQTWGTNNLTITPASGQQIQGCATNESLVCDVSGAWVELDWDPTNSWWVVSSNGFAASVSTGGGGSGEKTYIPAASQSTATGWASVAGTGGTTNATITISTDVTAADLPRAQTTKTGIKFVATAASGGTPVAAFGFLTWQLDPADYNKKLKVQFDMNALAGYTSGDYSIEVHSGTSAFNATTGVTAGTDTKLPLSTDSSGATTLPALEGTFRTTFDAQGSAAPYILLKVIPKTTAASSLVISDLIVGPGVVVQGAAVSGWQSYTPTITGFGTATSASFWYQRVGDDVFIRGTFTTGTSAASSATISLPNSWNINTAAFGTGYNNAVGAWFRDTASSATDSGSMLLNSVTPSNVIAFGKAQAVSGVSPLSRANGSDIAGTSEGISVWFRVPVAELAGSGTVNLAQNDVEFASNSSTSSSSDTSSFAYGPSGSVVPSFAAASGSSTAVSKRVQFNSPISSTDQLVLQFQDQGTGAWLDVQEQDSYGVLLFQGSTAYGVGLIPVDATHVDVAFYPGGRLSSNATYAGSGANFPRNSTDRYRVKKVSGGQAIGFSIVQPGVASGLVSASGVPGNTTGQAIASGYVGEKLETTTINTVNVTTAGINASVLTLTAGTWSVTGSVYVTANGTTNGGAYFASTSLVSGTNDVNYMNYQAVTTTAAGLIFPTRIITTTGTTIYGTVTANSIGGGPPTISNARLTAVRIA